MGMSRSEWRKYFQSSDADIWTVIKEALRLGASQFPSEFYEQRASIAEILFAPPSMLEAVLESKLGLRESTDSKPTESKMTVENRNGYEEEEEEEEDHLEDTCNREKLPPSLAAATQSGLTEPMGLSDDEKPGYESPQQEAAAALADEIDRERRILNQVREIKGTLAASSLLSDEELVETLQKLDDIPITIEVLKETEIGKQVKALKNHPSNDVRIATRRLIGSWKEIVDDWVQSASAIANEYNQEGDENGLDKHFLLPSPPMSDEELMAPSNAASVKVDDLLPDFEFNDHNPATNSNSRERNKNSNSLAANMERDSYVHEDVIDDDVEEYVPQNVEFSPDGGYSKPKNKSKFIYGEDEEIDEEEEDEEDFYDDEDAGEYQPMMMEEVDDGREMEGEKMKRKNAFAKNEIRQPKEAGLKSSSKTSAKRTDELFYDSEDEFYVKQERKDKRNHDISERERERGKERLQMRPKEKERLESQVNLKKVNDSAVKRPSTIPQASNQTKVLNKAKPMVEIRAKNSNMGSENSAKVINRKPVERLGPKEVNPQKNLKESIVKRPDSNSNPSSGYNRSSEQPPRRVDENQTIEKRLAEAKKRLRENYEEIEMAKKSRTIQVLEPKDVKNAKNKGKTHPMWKNNNGFQQKSSLFNIRNGKR